MSSPNESLGGQPLVVCGICGNIVNQANAVKKDIVTPKGSERVWVCKTCMHLGSEEQVRKYIFKEEKHVGR